MPYKIIKEGQHFRIKRENGSLIKNKYKTKENAEKIAKIWMTFEKKNK